MLLTAVEFRDRRLLWHLWLVGGVFWSWRRTIVAWTELKDGVQFVVNVVPDRKRFTLFKGNPST